MTGIRLFENAEFGKVKVLEEKEKFLFGASDIATLLGYSNPRDAVLRHCKGVVKCDIPTASGTQTISFIPEGDVYRLIVRSKLPSAEKFETWLFDEVLPSIRKTGGYIAEKRDETPEELMARALMIAQETLKRKEQRLLEAEAKVEELKPKALFADAVETSQRSCLVAELAKILKQNGVDTGQNRLFKWLRENGYLGNKGEYYNQPTQKAMDMGLFELKKRTVNNPDGTVMVVTTTKVTPKGQIYFVNKLITPKPRNYEKN